MLKYRLGHVIWEGITSCTCKQQTTVNCTTVSRAMCPGAVAVQYKHSLTGVPANREGFDMGQQRQTERNTCMVHEVKALVDKQKHGGSYQCVNRKLVVSLQVLQLLLQALHLCTGPFSA